MKKLIALAASVLLVGAGCAAQTDIQADIDANVDVNEQAPPPAAPPSGAAGTIETGTKVDVGADDVKVDAGAHVDLKADVTITAGGTFSPATLTVKAGTKVTWTNTGDRPVWPASAPHPVHNAYPGFDAKTDLRNGDTYSFTFDKKGSWDYHNHLNPSVSGTIIVE